VNVRVIVGDSRAMLATLPDESVAMTALAIWLVVLIRWDWPAATAAQRLEILGNALLASLALAGLVQLGLGLRNAIRNIKGTAGAQWNQTKPEMLSTSRCAAAFDNHNDYDRMTLRCSIYIKLGAEGARRAMRYCEEDREKKRIHAPCKIVQQE